MDVKIFVLISFSETVIKRIFSLISEMKNWLEQNGESDLEFVTNNKANRLNFSTAQSLVLHNIHIIQEYMQGVF